jgi:predicted DNA-binding protein YlxM (UPF0122 family)
VFTILQFNILFNFIDFLEIFESKKYQNGKKICQQLRVCIKKDNITVDSIKVLDDKKKNVSMLCASVLTNQESRKSIEDKISELMHVVEDCSKKIQLLESAINHAKELLELSNEVHLNCDIETTIETINNLKKTWGIKRVPELKVDTFWKNLNPLLGPAESLQPLVNLLSFMNVAKKCLKKLSNSSVDEDGNEASEVIHYDLSSF